MLSPTSRNNPKELCVLLKCLLLYKCLKAFVYGISIFARGVGGGVGLVDIFHVTSSLGRHVGVADDKVLKSVVLWCSLK
jgi:hypothetical protein